VRYFVSLVSLGSAVIAAACDGDSGGGTVPRGSAGAAGAGGQGAAPTGGSPAAGGEAGTPPAAGGEAGSIPTAFMAWPFDTSLPSGWQQIASGATTAALTFDPSFGDPAGSARLDATFTSATENARVYYQFPAATDLTGRTLTISVYVQSAPGSLWARLHSLDATWAWAQGPTSALIPGTWVRLSAPVETISTNPASVRQFGIQVGPQEWDFTGAAGAGGAPGSVVVNLDDVVIE
jgi:hypothetical protein